MREVPGLDTYRDCVDQAGEIQLPNGGHLAVLNEEQLIRASEIAGRPEDRALAEELKAARAARNLRESGLHADEAGEEPVTFPPSCVQS